MCDWLSSGEWCDVLLMCGGRSFNVHRAVLASVSSFLRKVLLSCPDESPVLIILPEFDLEAMSSVLYYIYNGEVVIPNHKLKMFLDTANAMEIFIDQQHIPQGNYCDQYWAIPRRGNEVLALENYGICYLRLLEGNNGSYINVKKDTGPENLVRETQKSIGSLNLQDNPIQTFCRWSRENVPDFGNLTSVSGYRQRQSYLRDIFIKTYSRDVNGQTAGMRAISNENYRVPTSVLLSNANEKHPSASDTVSDTLPQIIKKSSIFNGFKQLQHGNFEDSIEVIRKIRNYGLLSVYALYYISEDLKSYAKYAVAKNSRDTSSQGILENVCTMQNSKYSYPESCRTEAKVTILNEVLQSPWHPRQPNSYRPGRKRVRNSIHSEKNQETETTVNSNDENNYIDPQITRNVHDELVSSEQQEQQCAICYKVFIRRQDYDVHMRRHSSITRYSCGECHKSFSQLRNFKYHMSVHRGTKEFATTCSVCGKHFNDRGYLSNHMKIHRNRKEYKCASCPKSFNQRVAFNMHVRIHTGVKPHVCEECGKAFSRKMLLKQHQRTHSGERPYACAHCDRRFADRSNMTLHLRLHTGVKPFSCTVCPKSFTKKHHLKSHLNFHTGLKPYSCPRCKLAFTQSSNMRTHLKKCNTTN